MNHIIFIILLFVATGILSIQQTNAQVEQVEKLSFQLVPGSLEQNVSELLQTHSNNQLLLWQVSKKNQVIVGSVVAGNDVYHVLDQIISPYSEPFQIKASVFTKNGVVRIHYENEIL